MKNRIVKIFLTLVLAAVAVLGAVRLARMIRPGEPTLPASAGLWNDEEPPSQPPPQPVTLKMLSVGDNLIHSGIYEQAKKRAGGNGYDFSFAYGRIAESVAAADIATINQETVIVPGRPPSSYPRFNSPPELGLEVVRLGFDVVNMANNHMLDKGAIGYAAAIDWWDGQENVVRTGGYRNVEERDRLEFIERDGVKIGLIGVTQYTNSLSLPKDSALQIIYTSDEDVIRAKLEAARAACDLVLVNVHWGVEYTTAPTQDQRTLARKMADWGADIIIGHHPHVLQPIEWLKREDGGRTLVAYSLGNFISQQNTPARVIGGMLRYEVTKNPESGEVTVDRVRFETLVTHYVPGSHDIQIYPFSQYSDELAKKQAPRLKSSKFSLAYIDKFVRDVISAEFLAPAGDAALPAAA